MVEVSLVIKHEPPYEIRIGKFMGVTNLMFFFFLQLVSNSDAEFPESVKQISFVTPIEFKSFAPSVSDIVSFNSEQN
jgi:hypothetical protein